MTDVECTKKAYISYKQTWKGVRYLNVLGVDTKGADNYYEYMWEGVRYLNVLVVECTKGADITYEHM